MPLPTIAVSPRTLLARAGIGRGSKPASGSAAAPRATGPRFAALRTGGGSPKPKAAFPQANTRSGAASDNAVKAAVAANRTRTKAVLGSKQSRGREALAAALLDTEMSADQIIAALAHAARAQGANPMLGALSAGAHPYLGPGISDAPDASADADAVWARVHAARLARR